LSNTRTSHNDLKFSVIIPTYNRAYCVLDTINSVLQQSYPVYEIIVVDNCSTDNTSEVLSALIHDGKIKYIRHSTNLERSASRNTGLENSTGDFISFLDSDDFLYPKCLSDAAHYVAKHPSIKVFHCKYELVNKERNPIYQYEFPSLANQYKALASGNFMSNIGGFIHQDVYKTIRFDTDPKMIGSEDYLIWFSLFSQYKIGRINKINCGILEHENRSVNQGIYEHLEYQKNRIIARIQNDPVIYSKFKPYLNRLSSSFFMQMGLVAAARSKSNALQLVLKGVAADPTIILKSRFIKVIFNIIFR